MEVAIPCAGMDFDFNTARDSSPHLSAPSSPKGFGNYSFYSAPTSPTHAMMMSGFYPGFDDSGSNEEDKDRSDEDEEEEEEEDEAGDCFEFGFSKDQVEEDSVSAEELFDGGKIKPLNPPPPVHIKNDMISPRRIQRDSKPSAVFARENSRKRSETENTRGRETGPASLSYSTSGRVRAARSLSPCRVSVYQWEEDQQQQRNNDVKPWSFISKESSSANTSARSTTSISSNSKGSTTTTTTRKWRFRDFLLFRSASEGRANDKRDPYRKYHDIFRRQEESACSGRKGRVSAHELHYTVNKAVSEEMKRRTYLPYKPGIFGRFAF